MITIDPLVQANYPGIDAVQGWLSWRPEVHDLPVTAGPSNPRVRIVDYDAEQADPRVKGLEPQIDVVRNRVTFDVGRKNRWNMVALRQLSVFTTVLKTLDMFEKEDALGRRVSWAFGDHPLEVAVRFRRGKNARYFRKKRGIGFYYFDTDGGDRVYTAGSPDIVAHETSHAILDGIAPDLYHSPLPDALAIHEAVADLTALFLTFKMNDFTDHLLTITDGDLREAKEFGWIAEQFGTEVSQSGDQHYLRSLYSEYSLNEDWGMPANVDNHYELSQVFSGAVFSALIAEFEREEQAPGNEDQGKGLSLFIAASKIRRLICRGLDYLPPAEITLFDLAYAIISADEVAFPEAEDSMIRTSLMQALIKRGIGQSAADYTLDAALDLPHVLDGYDVEQLATDHPYLEQFVAENQQALLIPDTEYEVRAIICTDKKRFLSGGRTVHFQELIIKVTWLEKVRLDEAIEGAEHIYVRYGTSLVIDRKQAQLICRLSTSRLNSRHPSQVHELAQAKRIGMIKNLIASGHINRVASLGLTEDDQAEYVVENDSIHIRLNGMGLHQESCRGLRP